MSDKIHRHFRLFKPHNYLSQFIYEQKRKKKLLGELYPFPDGTMAIGRLDEDSEGLLLLTTDGKVSYYILSRKVEKEYYVQVDGIISEEAGKRMSKGVEIGISGSKYTTLPCVVKILESIPGLPPGRRIRDERHGPTSWVSITIKEGKYRQVRKMTAAVGYPTLRLVRVRIGNEYLGDMNPGEVEELNTFDV